jgi:hypothetical protein
LIDRIAQNWSHVVTPVIDIISDSTFEYKGKSTDPLSVGGFDWNLIVIIVSNNPPHDPIELSHSFTRVSFGRLV